MLPKAPSAVLKAPLLIADANWFCAAKHCPCNRAGSPLPMREADLMCYVAACPQLGPQRVGPTLMAFLSVFMVVEATLKNYSFSSFSIKGIHH